MLCCWCRILLKSDTVWRSYENVFRGLLFPGHSVYIQTKSQPRKCGHVTRKTGRHLLADKNWLTNVDKFFSCHMTTDFSKSADFYQLSVIGFTLCFVSSICRYLTLFKHDFVWYFAKSTLCSKRIFSEVLLVYSVDCQYYDCFLYSFLQTARTWY